MRRLHEEQGFTLLELLVVMLIIGILAAIAVPLFSQSKAKGQDSEAKMHAGSMHAHVESCFVETEDYSKCETADGTLETHMAEGAGPGQTRMVSPGPRDYTIEAKSRSGNVYRLIKVGGARPIRSCEVVPGGDRGGCSADSTW